MSDDSGNRQKALEVADRVRDDLLLTLRELDRRKNDTLNVPLQIDRHRQLITWSGIALGLGLVGTTATVILLQRRAEQRRLEEANRDRLAAVSRAWRYPRRIARPAQPKPTVPKVARQIAQAILIAVAAQAAKRTALKLLPATPEEKALAAAP